MNSNDPWGQLSSSLYLHPFHLLPEYFPPHFPFSLQHRLYLCLFQCLPNLAQPHPYQLPKAHIPGPHLVFSPQGLCGIHSPYLAHSSSFFPFPLFWLWHPFLSWATATATEKLLLAPILIAYCIFSAQGGTNQSRNFRLLGWSALTNNLTGSGIKEINLRA